MRDFRNALRTQLKYDGRSKPLQLHFHDYRAGLVNVLVTGECTLACALDGC